MRSGILVILLFTVNFAYSGTGETGPEDSVLQIKRSVDFEISGKGDNRAWETTSWSALGKKVDDGGKSYKTEFKMMYADKGIYLLFRGEDTKITTKDYKDFAEIYEGDVYEVFFHPDPTVPIYYEYEVNPMGRELILTLARSKGNTVGWAPWPHEYRQDRLVQRKVSLSGGSPRVGGNISSWTAEIFFPYAIFGLLPKSPPQSGTKWNANFCRIDYDSGRMIQWSWSPKIQKDFHELENLGTIEFE
jgi:hypothetical protein